MHIDKTHVRKCELDVEKLFRRADVTEEVRGLVPGVPAEAKRMLVTYFFMGRNGFSRRSLFRVLRTHGTRGSSRETLLNQSDK